jgi:hypothetical protein
LQGETMMTSNMICWSIFLGKKCANPTLTQDDGVSGEVVASLAAHNGTRPDPAGPAVR